MSTGLKRLDGKLEILAHHAPIITILVPGKVTITFADQEKGHLCCLIATLLVDSAELTSEINREQAQNALEKAEKNLESESADIACAKKLWLAKNRLKIYDDTYGQSQD